MSNSVETTSDLAKWRFDYIPALNKSLRSDPFSIGKLTWCAKLKNSGRTMAPPPLSGATPLVSIKLIPELAQDSSLIASFNIRLVSLLDGEKILFYQEFKDEKVRSGKVFLWDLWGFNGPYTGKFIIETRFLDLKTTSTNGGVPRSIWSNSLTQTDTNSTSLSPLARMLSESIHTDITICALDGTIGAHRAVLAACSPVFRSMFTHDLKEKEMSTINISDMSIEAFKAFLNYIYSNLQHQDFFNHRLDLLRAADKYDIGELKDACQESLIEDIDTTNVLERLQSASLYRLPKLKASCLNYLVKSEKIYDIREEFDAFMNYAARELIGEVVNEILSVRKAF